MPHCKSFLIDVVLDNAGVIVAVFRVERVCVHECHEGGAAEMGIVVARHAGGTER
jgi:hypothetical protein